MAAVSSRHPFEKSQQKNGLNTTFKPFFCWQGQKGSNPRHAVLETAALPTELCPYILIYNGSYHTIK